MRKRVAKLRKICDIPLFIPFRVWGLRGHMRLPCMTSQGLGRVGIPDSSVAAEPQGDVIQGMRSFIVDVSLCV